MAKMIGRIAVVLSLLCGLGLVAIGVPQPGVGAQEPDPDPEPMCGDYPCPSSFAALDAWSPATVHPAQRTSVPLAPRVGVTTPKVVAGLDFTDFNYDPEADGSTQGGSIDNLYPFGHWQQIDVAYFFEHSLVSVPPVVWTNAADRNGVEMLGVIEADFLHTTGGDRFNDLFTDEHVDRTISQLATMARAFGFDGWLFDPENGAVPNDNMVRAIAELRAGGFTVGYYEAAICELTTDTDQVTLDAAEAATFWQGDYPCIDNGKAQATYEWIEAQGSGLDRWDAYNASSLYAAEVWGEEPPCSAGEVTNGVKCLRLGSLDEPDPSTFLGGLALVAEGSPPDDVPPDGFWGSLAVYAPAWPAYGGSQGFPAKVALDVWRPLDDRIWNGTIPPVGPDCATTTNDGLVRWATPRPPVVTLPFTTTFNRGFGDSFSVLGTTVPPTGWNHIGMEDALPSWLCRVSGDPAAVQAALVDGPTWGGSSALEFDGSLPAGGTSEWGLWAAALPLDVGTGADEPVAVVRTSGTGPSPWLSLSFADGGTERVPLIAGTTDGNGWTSATAALGSFVGRTVTRVGLGFTNDGTDAAHIGLRVGELTLATQAQLAPLDLVVPAAPFGTDLTWDLPVGAVSANVWAETDAGCFAFLGPAYVATYDVANPLFEVPTGVTVSRYVVQPVNAAGVAAPLDQPPCPAGLYTVTSTTGPVSELPLTTPAYTG